MERFMTSRKVGMAGILILMMTVAVGVLYSQEHGGHRVQATGDNAASAEVFCGHTSTGLLCPGGAPNVLKLTGEKKQKWTEALRAYNKAVDAATKQMLADSKAVLSPEEYAQVEKWFAASSGVNTLINQALSAKK